MRQELLTVAAALMHMGSWAWSVTGNEVHMSKGAAQLILSWPRESNTPMAVHIAPTGKRRMLLSPWMRGEWRRKWARALKIQAEDIQSCQKTSIRRGTEE
jgi:hypothetical protein